MSKRSWLSEQQLERAKRLRAMGYTYAEISDRTGIPKPTIAAAAKRGFSRTTRQPAQAPGDFMFWATEESVADLCKRYSCCHTTIYRWINETGVERPEMRHRFTQRPVPDGFTDDAQRLSYNELVKKYRTTPRTIIRWKRQLGLPMPRVEALARARGQGARRSMVGWADTYFQQGAH